MTQVLCGKILVSMEKYGEKINNYWHGGTGETLY